MRTSRSIEDGPLDPPWDTYRPVENDVHFIARVSEEIMEDDEQWAVIVGDELDCYEKSELANGLWKAMKRSPECVAWMKRIATSEAELREERR